MWGALFPGQGSQTPGMGRFYYDQFQSARLLFESASDELKINFKKLCFDSSEEELTRTENAQPAIVLVSCTAWHCLAEEMDMSFIKYCAGHSVGEYSALVAGGALTLNTALKAVRHRGLLMSRSCRGTGSMSALIGVSPEEAVNFCQWVEKTSTFSTLEAANFNSPKQTVLSGNSEALSWAKKHLQEYFSTVKETKQPNGSSTETLEDKTLNKKIRMIPLKVSGPFHSSLMKSVGKQMDVFLKRTSLNKPHRIIIHNTTGKPGQTHPEQIKKNLTKQIQQPVLWLQSMQYLINQGCQPFLELGEGKVLAGLMKKINPSKEVFHFHSLNDIKTLQTRHKNY